MGVMYFLMMTISILIRTLAQNIFMILKKYLALLQVGMRDTQMLGKIKNFKILLQ